MSDSVLEWRARAEVPAAHPCLAGHFPGNPLIPAVLLLELVLNAVRTRRGPQWQLQRLLATKFLSPLRPDQPFEIVLRMAHTRLDFRCERAAQLVAQGSWEMSNLEPVQRRLFSQRLNVSYGAVS